jgi:hypothetical protein
MKKASVLLVLLTLVLATSCRGHSRNWIASLSRILFYSSARDLAAWGHALFTGEVPSQVSMDETLDLTGWMIGAVSRR